MSVLVATVGTQARLADLLCRRPYRRLLLVVSEQSAAAVGRVSEICGAHPPPVVESVLVSDPRDVTACYEEARRGVLSFAARIEAGEEGFVSITGGTKPMAVGLSLATAALGWKYIYMAEPGTAIAMGESSIWESADPYTIFLRIEWDVVVGLVRAHRYKAAIEFLDDRLRASVGPLRVLLRGLKDLFAALDQWDHFDHRKESGTQIRKATDVLLSHRDAEMFPGLSRYATECARLVSLADDCKRAAAIAVPSRLLLADLLGNADRRHAEGRNDDALARLYRGLEMAIQIVFLESFGCSTSDIVPGRLGLSAADAQALETKARPIQFGLWESLVHLRRIAHPLTSVILSNGAESEVQKLLDKRNHSILAHGVSPVDGTTYERFRQLLERARREIGAPPPPTFPTIPHAAADATSARSST